MIIGLTGTIGAGKGTVADYLVNQKKFKHYSIRGFLIEEVKKRRLEVNRDSITQVANELTAGHSPSYLAELLYEKAKNNSTNAVIESIRRPAEAEYLKKQGDFCLFAVDASPKIRYERIQLRKSETDNVTFEKFLEQEQREMKSLNPHEQNIRACVNMADFVFTNNGTFDDLTKQAEEALNNISK